MAKVKGAFFSLQASGTLGKCLTASSWRGVTYMRKWFIPKMGTSTAQVNMRIALALAMAYWVATEQAAHGAAWTTEAVGMQMSGVNLYMQKALEAYLTNPGKATAPTGVSLTGTPPNPTFTWTTA